MKITEKQLEYKISFEDEDEMKEFTNWCFDNRIFDIFRLNFYTKKLSYCNATITFNDEESAVAFKLRWI